MCCTLRRFTDPAEFLAVAGPLLLPHRAEHDLFFRNLHGWGAQPPVDAVMIVVLAAGRPVLAAIRTPPHPLVLSRVDQPEALAELPRDLHGMDLGTIVGPAAAALTLAEDQARHRQLQARVHKDLIIHELRTVADLPLPAGRLVPAGPLHADLLRIWCGDFEQEAVGRRRDSGPVDPAGVSLWEVDGEPRTCVRVRTYAGSATINLVYTPPAHRRRGYATATVQTVAARALADGSASCVLFTDAANPTANHIYHRIGFRPVAQWRAVDIGA